MSTSLMEAARELIVWAHLSDRWRGPCSPGGTLTKTSRLTESAWQAHEHTAPLLGPARSCARRPGSGPPLLFRRRCKALNFFRTYSFGYMHHHSAIFYLWAAWFAFSFVPFVSLARSLSFLSFFLSSSLWCASALWRAHLPARAWRSSISPSLPPLSNHVPPREAPKCCYHGNAPISNVHLSTGRLTRCRVRERRWVRSARNKK